MKLIYCPKCSDIVKLQPIPRLCWCGASGGHYKKDDEAPAVVNASAIPLGIHNYYFALALGQQPKEGLGPRFHAWVMPKETENIEVDAEYWNKYIYKEDADV